MSNILHNNEKSELEFDFKKGKSLTTRFGLLKGSATRFIRKTWFLLSWHHNNTNYYDVFAVVLAIMAFGVIFIGPSPGVGPSIYLRVAAVILALAAKALSKASLSDQGRSAEAKATDEKYAISMEVVVAVLVLISLIW